MTTPEQIEEKFNSLPEELKDIISGLDFGTIIPSLGEKYNLTIGKQGALHSNIYMLILGALSAAEFENTMKSELGLSGEQAEKILLDVDELVLSPIRMAYVGMSEEPASAEGYGEAKEETEKNRPSEEETPSLIREGAGLPAQAGGGFTESVTQTKLGVKTMADILKEEKAKNPLGLTNLPKTETDYSVPKITDPYKEKID